jgi:hypothetical protein
MKNSWFILSLMTAAFMGCAGTDLRHTQRAVRLPERVHVEISVDSSTMTYFVIVKQSDIGRFKDANQITLLIHGRDSMPTRLPMSITSMGAPGRSETITTMISCKTTLPAMRHHDSLVVEYTVGAQLWNIGVDNEQTTSTYSKPSADADDAHHSEYRNRALTLATTHVAYGREDSSYTFAAMAMRWRDEPTEYFPSSEQLRVRIIDSKGAIVWRSDNGMAFLAMIYPVEPLTVGSTHFYELRWNGLLNDGTRITPGTYQVEYTLPVKPRPYVKTTKEVFPPR